MVFIPVGLKSKIKDPPFLVAVIVVITAYVSIFNFSKLESFYQEFIHNPERQKYYHELRSVYIKECAVFQSQKTCEALNLFKKEDSIRSPYVANSDARRYLEDIEGLDSDLYLEWHSEEFMMSRLSEKQKDQELKKLKKISLENKKSIRLWHKKYDLLSSFNLQLKSLVKAQFTHSDWSHLIGNLVFFLFFGACLEQAMGRVWIFGIYFCGGTLGLLTQALLAESTSMFVLGASANIFACAGAFLRLYWKQPLQLFFSFFFVVNRTVQLPTWSFFLFFVIIQQLTGLASAEGSGVAHVAHMVGLVFGFMIAHLWSYRTEFKTNEYLIFPYEQKMLAAAKAQGVCKDKFNALIDVLFYAPYNLEAYKMFYITHNNCVCSVKCLSTGSQQFYARHSAQFIKELFLQKEMSTAAEIYKMSLLLGCDPKVLMLPWLAEDVMNLGNYLYNNKSIELLRSLFQAAALIFPDEQKLAFTQFLDSLDKEAEHAA